MRLAASIQALGRPEFLGLLRDELLREPEFARLLQRGLTFGTVALLDEVKLSLLRTEERTGGPRLRLGVHYSSIVTGCQCTDDPSPASLLSEYVEIQLDFDRTAGEAGMVLAPD